MNAYKVVKGNKFDALPLVIQFAVAFAVGVITSLSLGWFAIAVN